ncbi:MAG: PAS domain-containing protein [Euryarchaeota archaeon]|nr:PAS domain-containing protein [Euryarchaeota archaeon]
MEGPASKEFSEKEIAQATSVITCDLEGVVKTYSHGAHKLFGYNPDDVIGKMSVAVFHPPEKVAELVPRLLKTAVDTGLFEEEVVLVKKGGAQFRARLAVRPMYREANLVGYMGLTRPLE